MKKGISLVALVVTIIVLIILAGTIALTALDSNLFGKAENARDERNKQEVYSAVQREVLNVQSSKIGLAVSTEFATELQKNILERHKTSNATATYNQTEKNIAITFDLNGKTYNLTLDNKYRLTMDDTTIPPIDDDEEQFLIDLKNTYDKHYDEEKGAYHLYRIQMEMDEKYPDAQYTYMYIFKNVETIEGQKDMYLPMMTEVDVRSFASEQSMYSNIVDVKINYKNVQSN